MINVPGTIFGGEGGGEWKKAYVAVFFKWTIKGKPSDLHVQHQYVLEDKCLDLNLSSFL